MSDDAAVQPETADQASDTVPAYSWYALGVLVLVYVLNFIDRQILSIPAQHLANLPQQKVTVNLSPDLKVMEVK